MISPGVKVSYRFHQDECEVRVVFAKLDGPGWSVTSFFNGVRGAYGKFPHREPTLKDAKEFSKGGAGRAA